MLENLTIKSLNIFIDVDAHLGAANISYMDAVLHWCEKNQIEVEHIAPMLLANNISVTKLRRDAESLNFLKREIRIPL